MLAVSLYAAIIAYLELNFLSNENSDKIRNIGLMHTVLGFVISLLLVFRTNTAYDRWWEGRRVWGSLTNSSRNLAIQVQASNLDRLTVAFFQRMIPN